MKKSSNRAWTAPAKVQHHDGAGISEETEFFSTPPAEIGKIITVGSSLQTSAGSSSRSELVGLTIAISISLTMFLLVFSHLTDLHLSLVFPAAIGSVVAVSALASLRFKHYCSFVGELGIAEFTLIGAHFAKPKAQVLTFQNASNLYTDIVQEYANGLYQRTHYDYRWKYRGREVFRISGKYISQENAPEGSDRWYFAKAAETAWTRYLLDSANRDLQQRGYVEFHKRGNPHIVRVGKGFLEFVTNTEGIQQVAISDMQEIELISGYLRFKHQDSRWWSGRERYSFTYRDMPNVHLFLLCLHQIAGVPFQ